VTEPVIGVVTSATAETIDVVRVSPFVESTFLAAGLLAADAARIEAALAELLADVAALAVVRDHDEFCAVLRTWGADIVKLAEAVLGVVAPPGMTGSELAEVLVIELLRAKFGRLATLLAAAGVIVDTPGLGSAFDWEKLRDFLLDGPGVVSEDFWDSFLDATNPVATGAVPALMAALFVLAPEAFAMRSGDLRIAGLDPPPTTGDASAYWRGLRQASRGWISITLPLETRDGELVLPDPTDLGGANRPERAMSLLFRSRRRASGGRNVTDFETWVFPSADELSFERPLPGGAFLRVQPSVPIGLGYDGTGGTWNAAIAPRAASPVPATINEAVISLGKEVEGQPDLTFGPPDETRLIVRDLGVDLRVREQGEPSVELVARVHGFGVVLTNRWFRSLGLGSVVRDGIRIDADVDARLAEGSGFSLGAEGALETRLLVTKSISVLRLHSVVLRVPIRADEAHFDIRLEARPHWSLKLGPVTLVMDGAGAWVGWWADPADADKHCIGLVPPTGIGLQLDLPGVVAGGFIDFTGGPNDRYGGVLTVKVAPPGGLKGVSITAFGVHELSGSPGDPDRKSTLVLVLGVRFTPGVVFGPGIIWIGAGGLYGHNRRASTDALKERLTSGAIANVLFADDPVRNAPILLGDLATLFPPAAGVYVFGLTAQFGWTPVFNDYLIRAAVGVLLEFAGGRLTKIVILGSVIVHLPAGPGMSQDKLDKLLNIQVDVVGAIDTVRRTFDVDLTIRRGRFLEIFTLSGDGAIRASFGGQRYLMASLGGFHPDFHPQPSVFPPMKRVLLAIKDEDLPGPIDKLNVSAYLAVTTNTIQFGAELTASISSGHWAINGTIGGDALFALPFMFDVSVHGGVDVSYRGHSLIGVSFKGGIRGPSPIVLRGEVCVSLLLFDACWGDSIQLSSGAAIAGPVIASLVPLLADELAVATNLAVAGDEDPLVLAASPETSSRPVLSPLAAPLWSQNRAPLDLPIVTFEAGHLSDAQRLHLEASRPTTPHLDWFTPGSFLELSDAEEMALPSFELHQAGVVVSAAVTRSAPAVTPFHVEEIRIPGTPVVKPGLTLPGHVLDRLDAVGADLSMRPRPPRFELDEPGFQVEVAGTVTLSRATAIQARVEARTSDGTVQHSTDRLVDV
jgi:hypothetical protein